MNKNFLIFLTFFSFGFSISEIKYFSDIFFDFNDITWKLYKEIPVTDLKGVWYKKHSYNKNNLTFVYNYDNDKPKSLYQVFYNNQKQIMKITHTQKKGVIHFFYVKNKLMKMSNSLILSNLPTSKIDFYYLNDTQDGKAHFLQIKNQYGGLEFSKHYDYKESNEIKIITSFPKGKIKSLEIYKKETPNQSRYKIKYFAKKNADFIVDSPLMENDASGLHFQKDFDFLININYLSLLEYDKEVIRYDYGASDTKELILTPGNPPVLIYLFDNQIKKQVVLKDTDAGFSSSYSLWNFLDFEKSEWSNYVLWEYDEVDVRYFLKETYQDGLLKKKAKMLKTPVEALELSSEVYRHFPNRQLFNVSIYQNGELIEEKQTHYLPES